QYASLMPASVKTLYWRWIKTVSPRRLVDRNPKLMTETFAKTQALSQLSKPLPKHSKYKEVES
ncbi:MAG: hypothetical protein ACREAM_07630, partial [Blastocatellia bacterium]